MRHRDLILIHPPSVLDFREKPLFWGPISDTVPSTPLFDIFPIGFISLAEYLHRFGFKTDVINLAAKMLDNRRLNVERFLSSLNSDVFGLDLHWLPHVQGCLEVAKLLKTLHPNSRIVLGGLTSTYYYQEIMSCFPYVDAVVRGDSGELPLQRYLELVGLDQIDLSGVPNLSWRDRDGKTCNNPITHVQDSLDELAVDYRFIASFMMKNLFNADRTPYFEWKRYPIAATLFCKGCLHDCVTCGGSKYSYGRHFNRAKLSLRSPEAVVRDIAGVSSYRKIPVWLIGDIRQGGSGYTEKFLRGIREEKIDSPVILELFEPADADFLNEAAQSIPRLGVSFSPDSGSEAVRRAQGRNFSNFAVEKTISSALNASISRLDLFFLLGLGRDTPETISETFQYAEALIRRFSTQGLSVYMSTLMPTLDPGSPAFDNPSDHGFHLHYRSLEEHYWGFSQPSWKYFVNYRTDAFDVEGIVDLTYRTASFLAYLKAKFGLMESAEVELVRDRIAASRALLSEIDDALKMDDEKRQEEALRRLTVVVQRDRGDRLLHRLNEMDRRSV